MLLLCVRGCVLGIDRVVTCTDQPNGDNGVLILEGIEATAGAFVKNFFCFALLRPPVAPPFMSGCRRSVLIGVPARCPKSNLRWRPIFQQRRCRGVSGELTQKPFVSSWTCESCIYLIVLCWLTESRRTRPILPVSEKHTEE